ncbi:MAG: biosynthetic arginine decarboxylase [Epsilonproteobacteria bacterium]|nr:biosynthetic arginine decarboxylase [Campylobacterota bacterium]
MNNYGVDIWGDNNFLIEESFVKLNYKSKPSLYQIVKEIRDQGKRGPLLLRFPHLIKKQIDNIYQNFERASTELHYKGKFQAVFPLKVNQFPSLVNALVEAGEQYHYGLEAGSKAELLIAMSHTKNSAPITVNGFKDKEMIELGFISAQMGQDITITIEGINELETILEVVQEQPDVIPAIGLRIKLHSLGVGLWAKSGGINSKFGLTSTELIKAIELLKSSNLLHKFTMIHFHIGSQITDIGFLKKAIREAGNIYADLVKLGAFNLGTINLGGGLAIEYAQHKNNCEAKYSLREYANDIIFMLSTIVKSKKVQEPNIMIESGRYVSASHAVLVAPVFELVSEGYIENDLNLKEINPPLITELHELYQYINTNNALEYLHDALDHLNSLLTLFDLGYVDLQDRSNSEVLTHLIIKKSIYLLQDKNLEELLHIQDMIQEKYLINFSMFQSMPDFWGLNQHFPVMPLAKLDQKPTRSASLWDITCDSDGEIGFNAKNPLFLHSIDLSKEEYFLGFFLIGAYQEVLGMDHNLFVHPTEATIEINSNGYEIKNLTESSSIIDILDDLNYDTTQVRETLIENINKSSLISITLKEKIINRIAIFLEENGYLKTVK